MIIYDPILTGSLNVNGTPLSSIESIDTVSGSVVDLIEASGSFSDRVSSTEASINSLNSASSSYALETNISGAFESVSASIASDLVSNYLRNTTDTLDGDLTVTGKITAQEFHTEFVSASIIYQSGSTQFGNSADDTHTFTGSINLLGAIEYGSPTLLVTGTSTDGSDNQAFAIGAGGTLSDTRGAYIWGRGNEAVNGGKIQINAGNVSTGNIELYTGGNVRMFVSSSGKIGIGTPTPLTKVHIRDSGNPTLTLEGSDAAYTSILQFNAAGGGGSKIVKTGGAGNLTFEVDGSSSLNITPAGNIGIGITSPSSTLTINGPSAAIATSGNGASGHLRLTEQPSSGATLMMGLNGGAYGYLQMTNTVDLSVSYPLALNPNGSSVLVGTTSKRDQERFAVVGTTLNYLAEIRETGTGGSENSGLLIYYPNTAPNSRSKHFLLNADNSATKSFLSTDGGAHFSGNVSIGTTLQSSRLDVRISGANGQYGRPPNEGNLYLANTNTGNTEGGWMYIGGYMGNTVPYYQMGAISGGKTSTAADGYYGGFLSFWTTSQGLNGEANSGQYERTRITSAGTLLHGDTVAPGETAWRGTAVFGKPGTDKVILGYVGSATNGATIGGHSSALTAWGPLHVAGSEVRFNINETRSFTVDGNRSILFGKTARNVDTNGTEIYAPEDFNVYSSIGSPYNTYHVYDTLNNRYSFYVSYLGTIYARSTSISSLSDIRLKENIRDLNSGLDTILKLKPRVFDWKDGSKADATGFIAQEVETVKPDCVEEWVSKDSPQNEAPYKTVKQDFIPEIVKAIQELKAENDLLKARIEALEG